MQKAPSGKYGCRKIATAEDGERPLKFQDTDAAEAFSTSTAAATDSHIVMSTSNRLLIAGSIGVVIFMGASCKFCLHSSDWEQRTLTNRMLGLFYHSDREPNPDRRV